MFLIGATNSILDGIYSTLILTAVVVLGVLITLLITRLLSKTLLKGVPSSFTLEMPPYRVPQVGKVLIRAMLDRTLFVLGRAAAVAAPAGMLIWLMANIKFDGNTILTICAEVLDPIARFIGLDGVILMAFILGFPANEIVVPIILMIYTSSGSLIEMADSFAIKEILTANGWTFVTAICVIIFSLMHWPCSTTLLTIKKESGSFKWALLSAVMPTICGIIICAAINWVSKIIL